MPRYILIDNASGFIFGDTADMPAHTFAGEAHPVTADAPLTDIARWLDEAVVKEFGSIYTEKRGPEFGNERGYHVYRADLDGGEAIPVVKDGQDEEAIGAVMDRCVYAGYVSTEQVED